ncbi:glucan synthase-like 7, callose synthase 7, Arabidopsis thaliana glucan synthase-like 7 [Hibiscus trionum]|uniref:1,3-beta-glucan synthase n=1 Tax=Hibiscus trionum TaxID=183268 RepID=A0A9W7MJA8_HIBTR|nr:glucan synthase-like 7, callose synthase 7, Arabidopsis thaliana glucan synthase-like 7 [Hibiscus trionum]
MASSSGTKPDRAPSRMSRVVENPSNDNTTAHSEMVPSILASIVPILRVADEIEKDNPRVAYLCRFHALEMSHTIDRTSSGRGVRQFKIHLLRRLEREEEETKPILARSDPTEIQMYYKQFYLKNIAEDQNTKKPDEMAKFYQIASVLYDVLRYVVPASRVDDQTKSYAKEVDKKKEQFEHYNILPLHAWVKPVIMELPEIKAALTAIQNLEGLPILRVHISDDPDDIPQRRVNPVNDILDWLSSLFGFQKGNVANQREHLILLLANINVRKNENFEDCIAGLMDNIFKNYRTWCNYLRCKSHLRFQRGCDQQQLKLIYISLYLLIWGEASNIRFMPECICYIFHNMANEVYGVLFNTVHPLTGETYVTAAPDDELFLRNVITPIYALLQKEVKSNKGGKGSHSKWRNYDDLNEYFWSWKCFQLKWPMDSKSDFFVHSNEPPPANERHNQATVWKRMTKTNFVEARTFWHIYRSFDRMWMFFIMAFQAMLIVAWNSGSHLGFSDKDVLRSVSSIFVTSAFLNFLQASLDIMLTLNAWRSLKITQMLRYLLKFAIAAFWAVVLPISYSSSVHNPTGLLKFFSNWVIDWQTESFYNYAVAIYLIPNILAALLFLLPPLRKSMERSNWKIVTLIMWWSQPKLYVGRGMHEDFFSLLKYTVFWILVLISKLAFSYYVEILPLIQPTKIIMDMHVDNYQWRVFFSEVVTPNIGVIIAIWSPVVLVYFMDAQIWYAIFSTFFGGIHGAFSHLGEIRTLEMFRSRFQSVPSAFFRHLVPLTNQYNRNAHPVEAKERKNIATFSLVWNEFIHSMLMEDLISTRDRDLLQMPSSSNDVSVIPWPLFLLASKIPIAIDMARNFRGKDDAGLFTKIAADVYMHNAIIECYETLEDIFYKLLEDEADKIVVRDIFHEVYISIQQQRFLTCFRMSRLPSLSYKLDKLLWKLLCDIEDADIFRSQIINVLQDLMEIIIMDVMVCGNEIIERAPSSRQMRFENIDIALTKQKIWREKIKRLYLILTCRESAINMPPNLEAQRRITFFANSLFMNMPDAPKVRDMLSFSVLTSYYKEDVLYSNEELTKENEDGISILFYLQRIYPDEWYNFMQRMHAVRNEDEKKVDMNEEIQKWASYRAQTLSRTVRGMMYYRQALELQYFLEFSGDSEVSEGFQAVKEGSGYYGEYAQAVANLKFTYVISCELYGAQKKSSDARDRSCYLNILNLMLKYPSLRVAYIDEIEETMNGRSQKVYYSVLVKGGEKLDEEIYRIKLPGPPTKIGEEKSENQNHAIIFTRGEALQTIDMNQDNYFEEAYKMRNVLEEFLKPHHNDRKPSILGLREHVFTGSGSSLAWFVSNQETSFVTVRQRILSNPLRVRFHYGHPDIFDRIFHITRGGISKASKTINLSEHIFAGFNSTLRGGYVTHHEYIQVGKGCDVGMTQVSAFEAKVANGNGEQTLSRDIYRLGHQFDFYRMLSFYFSTVGFYFSIMVAVLTVYVFLYGRLYMIMSGWQNVILVNATIYRSKALEEALATQSVFQLCLLVVLPIVMETGLEKGFDTALGDFILMQLQLASVFFTFQLGTKAHYYGRTILHGGSKYRATDRGFVVFRERFAGNYRLYSRSHFVKGLELLVLLALYEFYGESYHSSSIYRFMTFSMWFLVGSWLFAPFLFNPFGFNWKKTMDDWIDWRTWMGNRGGIGIHPDKSWESWWEEEQEHLKFTNIRGRLLEIILAFRFYIYQYVIVYHLDIAHHSKSILVYGLSWIVVVTALLVLKIVSVGRRRFGTHFQLIFRILKALLALIFISFMTVLFVKYGLTISDLFAAILAFLPTGWAILLIGQALRPVLKSSGGWELIMELARAYEEIMGAILFMPIAMLSWFPSVSKMQTRLLLRS